MDNKEIIKRFISFDEDDTSTGFVNTGRSLNRRSPWSIEDEPSEGITGMYDYLSNIIFPLRDKMLEGIDVFTDVLDLYLEDDEEYIPLISLRITEADGPDDDRFIGGDDDTDENVIDAIDELVKRCDRDLASVDELYDYIKKYSFSRLMSLYPDRQEYTQLWIVRPLKIVQYIAKRLQEYTYYKTNDINISMDDIKQFL